MQPIRRLAILLAATAVLAPPAVAQDEDDLPYWASINAEEAYLRSGPGEQFPIEWVYTRDDLPVRVVRFLQGWRYIEEPDGTTGWMSASLLSRQRTAIVTGDDLAPMRERGSSGASVRWNLEPGVVGLLGDCTDGWCELDVAGHTGWVEAGRLWGAGEP